MPKKPLTHSVGWIAFLDLLGTKRAVADFNEQKQDKFASFFDSVCISGTAYKLRGAPLVPMRASDWVKHLEEPFSRHYASRTNMFGDSLIVASAELDEDFFRHIISIIQSAWDHDLAIRGALAYGSYVADSGGRAIHGAALVEASQWEGAQDWAWVSVSPESMKSVSGESSVLREATVPSKRGMLKTYALRPSIPEGDDLEGELDAEKLADITFKTWLSATDSGAADVRTKCKNTLLWLEQDGVGPLGLKGKDAEQLEMSFVDEEVKIRIRLNKDESTATREPFLQGVEVLQQQLECLEVQWDPNHRWCVLRVRYAGSPLRRHTLMNAVSQSFRKAGLGFWCDIAPAEIDFLRRDAEFASDPVKSLVPPGNFFTFGGSKPTTTTASSSARFSLATGIISATSTEALIDLMLECLEEKSLETAEAMVKELDSRVPAHVWPIAQRVLTATSFAEIVGLRFVRVQPQAEWWSDGEYWYNRGIVLRELGRIEDALESTALAVAFRPSNADAWDEIGQHLRRGRPESAIRWHEQAIRLLPTSCRYRNHLGRSLLLAGRLEEAERAFVEVLKLDPGYLHALVSLAWVYVYKMDTETALRYVAEARTAGIGEVELLPVEVIASWRAQDFNQCLDALDRARSHEFGSDEQATFNLLEMHCLIEVGCSSEALEKVETKGEPQDASDPRLLLYAQALISLGRSAEAKDLFCDREIAAAYESEADFVAELARREAGPYDSPLNGALSRPLRPASFTLCLSTIRRAAKYSVL